MKRKIVYVVKKDSIILRMLKGDVLFYAGTNTRYRIFKTGVTRAGTLEADEVNKMSDTSKLNLKARTCHSLKNTK